MLTTKTIRNATTSTKIITITRVMTQTTPISCNAQRGFMRSWSYSEFLQDGEAGILGCKSTCTAQGSLSFAIHPGIQTCFCFKAAFNQLPAPSDPWAIPFYDIQCSAWNVPAIVPCEFVRVPKQPFSGRRNTEYRNKARIVRYSLCLVNILTFPY